MIELGSPEARKILDFDNLDKNNRVFWHSSKEVRIYTDEMIGEIASQTYGNGRLTSVYFNLPPTYDEWENFLCGGGIRARELRLIELMGVGESWKL